MTPPLQPIRFAWAYHEALRRLGFRADDISVGIVSGVIVGVGIMPVVHVRLVVDGREFGIHAATWDLGEAAFRREWQAFIDHLIGTPGVEQYRDDELQALWDQTVAELNARPDTSLMGLPGALVAKGFSLPSVRRRKN